MDSNGSKYEYDKTKCTHCNNSQDLNGFDQSNLSNETIEAWLDTHPDFVQSYVSRKVNRTIVDSFRKHTKSWSRSSTPPFGNELRTSGSTTPVRKISASDLGESRGILKPLVSVVDGSPSFLTLERSYSRPSRQRKSKEELLRLRIYDEYEFFVELLKDIANDLEVTTLCHKILQNVSVLTGADRCSLFLVQGPKEGPRFLVSKVFDVNADSCVEDLEDLEEIRIPYGTGIVGYAAATGETVNITDAYKDSRFNKDVDIKTGYHTKSILCMPMKNPDGEVLGVAQVINKSVKDGNNLFFNEVDEKIFAKYLTFCGLGIANAQLYEKSQIEIKRNQVLLDLARVIFEEQSTLHNIVHKIMMNTQSLLQCERCSVLLVDASSKGLFSQAFDLEARDFLDDDGQTMLRKQSCGSSEVRFPINIGITGYVATTGETLNIPDAYADPRFDPSVDEGSGFCTRTILCMPIRNSNSDIIGVVQLLNKMDGLPFNPNDENLFEAFAIFCGMAIHNTTVYEDCNRALAKQKVALEVLSYHATESADQAIALKEKPVPSAEKLHLLDFYFDDKILPDDGTPLATLRMFLDLGLTRFFSIDYQVLCRFILTVKKNYRDVTYHNWRHAFNVAQMMFAMLQTQDEFEKFDELEQFALLVACLCHDLDHRGTNNSFQIKSESPLAQLYSTSTMERHHFDHCIMILNSPGNEIMKNMTEDQYSLAIRLLEQCIIATDLALYFKKRTEFYERVDQKTFQMESEDQKSLLRSMLMTACDISAITKPWPVQQRVAHLVAEEFFQQGDLEQIELKQTPAEMMDRAKKDQLPRMQVGFIDFVCHSIYDHLAKQFTGLKPLVDGVVKNRKHWQKLADDFEERAKANNYAQKTPLSNKITRKMVIKQTEV